MADDSEATRVAEARARITETAPAAAIARRSGGDVIFLDVREMNEWNLFRIPGAVHVPIGTLAAQAERAVPRDRDVIVYCNAGSRSVLAPDELRARRGRARLDGRGRGAGGLATVGIASVEALLTHPIVARLERALREQPGAQLTLSDPLRRAAVALILRDPGDGTLEFLMIKRADYEGDPWSGHVALPGGRHEQGDPTLEATAIRETWEETGCSRRSRSLRMSPCSALIRSCA